MAKKKPTQMDVAKRAGVSRATVSYVLNNNTAISISEETRQRIFEAIDELGYIPDSSAQRLRTGRTYTIASIIPDITNPYYPILERKIQEVAKQHGYIHITYNTDGVRDEELRCLQSAQQNGVEGIFGSFFHIRPEDLKSIVENNTAVVILMAGREDIPDFPLDILYLDNVAGAACAVEHLIEHHHTRIGIIGGTDVDVGQRRKEGYLKALAEHEIPVDEELIRYGNFTEEGGYREMLALLKIDPRPTAIFAANDLMALGALYALRECNLRVPDDVAIVGFDDIPASRLVSPPLTSIRKSQNLIGQRAADMMIGRLEKQNIPFGRCEEIPFELIIRQSV